MYMKNIFIFINKTTPRTTPYFNSNPYMEKILTYSLHVKSLGLFKNLFNNFSFLLKVCTSWYKVQLIHGYNFHYYTLKFIKLIKIYQNLSKFIKAYQNLSKFYQK